MGEIQSSINSAIGSAAILTGLAVNSPAGKDFAEKRSLDRKEKVLNKQYESVKADVKNRHAMGETDFSAQKKILGDIQNQRRDIMQRRFELDPTYNNYDKYSRYLSIKTPQERAAQRALEHSDDAINAKVDQKFNLREHIDRLSVPERRDILRYAAHVQSGAKRTEQHNQYEEGKK